MTAQPDLDENALTAAHKAVEDALVDFRDRRISVPFAANGLVIRAEDGQHSDAVRLTTREGLAIGIRAYLNAVGDVPS